MNLITAASEFSNYVFGQKFGIAAGGMVTLEVDVEDPITISTAVTLDLNGKSVTSLTVNHAAAKIKDSGGTKGTITTLAAGTGVTIGSLCEDGYGFQSGVRLEGGYTEGINVTPVWFKTATARAVRSVSQ